MNRRLAILLAIVAGVLLPSSLVPARGQAPLPPGPLGPAERATVVRVYYPDDATRIRLFLGFEPWLLETNYAEGYHVMRVTQAELDRLAALGLRVAQDTTWVAPAVLESLPAGIETIPGYNCYRTVEETYAAAEALVAAHSDLAGWADVGDSWERATAGGATGYDLRVLKLTNSAVSGPDGGDKPDLFVTASIHAREYAPAELVTRFAEYLVDNYETDADAHWLLDHHEIHLMLHANPDGRKKAETGLSWRKNTRENCSTSQPPRGDGIDLNRNYAFQWGCCGGSSGTKCDETYRGTAAASEPETQAVQDYMAAIFADQRGPGDADPAPDGATGLYLDIHSYSELVLWPWGWTSADAPNLAQLQTLGRKFAAFNSYTPQKSYQLYATDGTTDDHAYGVYGVASYCWELGTQFFQSCTDFEEAIYPDNLDALIYAAKVARTPYRTPLGPDALSLALSGDRVPAGTAVTLSASIDDTGYNNSNGTEPTQNIAAAEYYVDTPPWLGGTAHAMAASDGSFDSKVESVTATVGTTGWTGGKHIMFVRGQDAGGNWGAFSAVFLTTAEPTAVGLLWFEARPGKSVTLGWETAGELDNLGFNLYRATAVGGQRIKLNAALIPSAVEPDSPSGAVYSYQDALLKPNLTYYYWLEAVGISGGTELFGPAAATVKLVPVSPGTEQ